MVTVVAGRHRLPTCGRGLCAGGNVDDNEGMKRFVLCLAVLAALGAHAAAPAPVPATVSPGNRVRVDVKPGTPPPRPSEKTGYSGHGADSVDAEAYARFRAAPLPTTVTRRVQALLDVRSPSSGALAPDGKKLFFTWNVTGVRQVWRLDGPDRFPVQMTGGEDATSAVAVTRDGRFVVVSRDQKGEENPGLYLQPVDGGALQVIQHKPKVQTEPLHLSDDGRYLYFRSNDVRDDAYVIYRWVFATKTIERVFDGEGLWSIADRDDVKGKLL
ncbi:MAG TPA: hypothetical protein VGF99_13775, partial [Myxococcota bacterium]